MESTLNLSMADLLGEGGAFLGWGRDTARWNSKKAEDVKSCGQSMLRKFYFQANNSWTFLKPVATLQLASGVETIPLPDDFGGFEGKASCAAVGATGGGFWPLAQFHEEQIRVKYAAFPTATGRPVGFAEQQIKGTTLVRSNKSQLVVYPIPDADYVLQVPYYILPSYLTVEAPWPYGGAAHAETMKAGMRAAAELFLDNEAGPESANYAQCLAASIQYDRRHQPKTLGINSDLSQAFQRGRWPEGLWHPLGVGYLGEASY